jgi:hypothetical protein
MSKPKSETKEETDERLARMAELLRAMFQRTPDPRPVLRNSNPEK